MVAMTTLITAKSLAKARVCEKQSINTELMNYAWYKNILIFKIQKKFKIKKASQKNGMLSIG